MFKDKDAERCEHNGEGVHGGNKRFGQLKVKRRAEEKRRIKEK